MTIFRSVLIVTALSVAACAERPFVEIDTISSQRKMNSTHHWEKLAERTARHLVAAIRPRDGTQTSSHMSAEPVPLAGHTRVFVQQLDSSMTFSSSFRELLISKLLERGVAVSTTPEASAVVNYRVQIVPHDPGKIRRSIPGPASGLAAMAGLGYAAATTSSTAGAVLALGGLALAADGLYILSDDPLAEVIITVSVLDREEYLFRQSSIFYVDDRHIANYVGASAAAAPLPTRHKLEAIEPWEAYTLAVRDLPVTNR